MCFARGNGYSPLAVIGNDSLSFDLLRSAYPYFLWMKGTGYLFRVEAVGYSRS